MGITVKADETATEDSANAVASTLALADLESRINANVKTAMRAELDGALSAMESVKETLLTSFRADIAGYAKPKSQVLAVEVNGERRKLSKEASPLLGPLLVRAQCGINSMIVGPAGCGKTTVAHQVAEALGRRFGHLCFTAGASESWVFGRQTPNTKEGFIEGEFCDFYENGGVFLLDEFDGADANMAMALNTALANGHLKNPISGKRYARHAEFCVIAACNTYGKGGTALYTGRARLDAATLSRFTGGILTMGYDVDLERRLCPDEALATRLFEVRAKLLEIGSQEFISTRHFENGHVLKQAGLDYAEILESFSAGWPDELLTQTKIREGLTKKRKVEAKPEETQAAPMVEKKHEGKRYGAKTPCKICKAPFGEHDFASNPGKASCNNGTLTTFVDGSSY